MKKVISILLLCIVVLLCLVGCTDKASSKAYEVKYNDNGYIEQLTIMFELDKNLAPNEEIYFGIEDDHFNLDGDEFGFGLFNKDGQFIDYRIEFPYKRFEDLKSFRAKGDTIIINVVPKEDLNAGKFAFFTFNKMIYDLKWEDGSINDDSYKDYIRKNTTKYTFTF